MVSYGQPASGQQHQRPNCWGDSRIHDTTSRECRTCHASNSCSEQITRTRNAQQSYQTAASALQAPGIAPAGTAYFANYAPPQVSNPLPVVQPLPSPVPPPSNVAGYNQQPVFRPQTAPVQQPVAYSPQPQYQPQYQTQYPQQYQPQYQQQVQQRPQPAPQVQNPYGFAPPPPPQDRYGWLNDPLAQQMAAIPPPVRPQFVGESFAVRVGKNMFLAATESLLMQAFLGVRQLLLPPTQEPASNEHPPLLPPERG